MFNIDEPTAVASPPAVPAAGTEGYFTGGSPATGTPPTKVRAWWLNMVQQELAAIVAAASIARSKVSNAQVLLALRALFMPRGSTTGGHAYYVYTPDNAGSTHTNTLTFTPSVPGLVYVLGSINLGSPGQQPNGCTHQVAVNGAIVSTDSTTGNMNNHGVATVAASGVVTIQQTYATPPGSTGWCSSGMTLSYIFVPT